MQLTLARHGRAGDAGGVPVPAPAAPTIAAGITVPLSLAGTCAAMWAAGFSIDNLSLMALAVCVGFVVDDAIVMIENVFRILERGAFAAARRLKGARQIGFTVVSISVSLIAAFIPLLFMGGIVGRLFREFSVTLAFAIGVSTIVSLTVTPMICAYFVHKRAEPRRHLARPRWSKACSAPGPLLRPHAALRARAPRADADGVRRHHRAHRRCSIIDTPKGYFPQDDTGLIFGGTEASTDISFDAMEALQLKAMDVVLADPAVAGLGSIGRRRPVQRLGQPRPPVHQPEAARRAQQRADAGGDRPPARASSTNIPGMRVFLVPAQDLRVGGRQSNAQYQFTLWSSDIDPLQDWVPKVLDRVKQVPGIIDVTTDREQGGLQANVVIDRQAATRLGVRIQDIDNALNDAFSQRQISTIYSARNQYRVVLEVAEQVPARSERPRPTSTCRATATRRCR